MYPPLRAAFDHRETRTRRRGQATRGVQPGRHRDPGPGKPEHDLVDRFAA